MCGRQYPGTLGKIGNCQIGVSVHLVSEDASCAADWRLFCPDSWDDQALDDPVAAAGAARRRERAGIPDHEGRSFTGWHRHITLAALAQAFCTLLRTGPKAPAPG